MPKAAAKAAPTKQPDLEDFAHETPEELIALVAAYHPQLVKTYQSLGKAIAALHSVKTLPALEKGLFAVTRDAQTIENDMGTLCNGARGYQDKPTLEEEYDFGCQLCFGRGDGEAEDEDE